MAYLTPRSCHRTVKWARINRLLLKKLHKHQIRHSLPLTLMVVSAYGTSGSPSPSPRCFLEKMCLHGARAQYGPRTVTSFTLVGEMGQWTNIAYTKVCGVQRGASSCPITVELSALCEPCPMGVILFGKSYTTQHTTRRARLISLALLLTYYDFTTCNKSKSSSMQQYHF